MCLVTLRFGGDSKVVLAAGKKKVEGERQPTIEIACYWLVPDEAGGWKREAGDYAGEGGRARDSGRAEIPSVCGS